MPEQAIVHLSEAEIALVDAIKSMMAIMMARNIATATELEAIFSQQRDGCLGKASVNGAAVMEMLRAFAAKRGADNTLLKAPPAGSA